MGKVIPISRGRAIRAERRVERLAKDPIAFVEFVFDEVPADHPGLRALHTLLGRVAWSARKPVAPR